MALMTKNEADDLEQQIDTKSPRVSVWMEHNLEIMQTSTI